MEKGKTIKFAIYIVLLCAIYGLGYQLIFLRVIKKGLIPQKTELYAYSLVLKEKQETLDEFNKLAASYKAKRSTILKFNQILLEDEKNKIKIGSSLFAVAGKSGVLIDGLTFGELKSGGEKVGALPVNITIKSNYDNFKKFLQNISYILPLTEVETMSLGAIGGKKIDSYSIGLIIYTKNMPVTATQPQSSSGQEEGQKEVLPEGTQGF